MSLRFPNMSALRAAMGDNVKVTESSAPAVKSKTRTTLPCRARKGATPHDILWDAMAGHFDGAVREFKDAVPGRKYRIDIALPDIKLAIEVDGWEWHGKHKGDFTRDRARQNLLTENGWHILRFTAGQIRKDTAACVDAVRRTKESCGA